MREAFAGRDLKGDIDLKAAFAGAGRHAGATTAVPPGDPDPEAAIPPARQLLPVAIASDPPGARIEVENMFAGKTPATIKLQPGEYRVSLTLAGHGPGAARSKCEPAHPPPWRPR